MTTTSNSNPVDPSTKDLLRIFDSFTIPKEHAIPETDLKFCEEQQRLLYETLDRINHWYHIFREEAEQYRQTHGLSYFPNGIPDFRGYYNGHDSVSEGYKKFEFKPFDVMTQLVKSRLAAIHAFAGNITGYFNDKYRISVPVPETDTKNLTIDFRPVYTAYTSLVEQHLQGRSFLETAEEELINRFHQTICHTNWYNRKIPQLKSDKIIFHEVIRFDEFDLRQNRNSIHYGYREKPDIFCEGILFGSEGKLSGNAGIIQDLDNRNVDTEKWYSLKAINAQSVKFYRNGRIDVRFSDASKARNCFDRLRLNVLTPLNPLNK
jgi:hypothetical protein